MTTAEFKLAATAFGMTLLLAGVVAWLIYDWLMVRERRKRRRKSGSKKQRPLRSDVPSTITESIGDTGMTVRLHNDKIVIAEIEPHSLASKAGLRPGFVIEDIVGVNMKELRAGLSCP
jgi:hypothetical protein